jgi:hypothetical protein
MMMIELAPPDRFAEVATLLERERLPTSDLDPGRVALVVARSADTR